MCAVTLQYCKSEGALKDGAPPGRLGFLLEVMLAGIAVHPAVRLAPAHRELEQRVLVAAVQAPLGGSFPGLQVWLPVV
jgi:hypothetical protein